MHINNITNQKKCSNDELKKDITKNKEIKPKIKKYKIMEKKNIILK